MCIGIRCIWIQVLIFFIFKVIYDPKKCLIFSPYIKIMFSFCWAENLNPYMKTLERESGPDLWFKIKNILDLFLRFYYLLEVKPYEFLVFENFGRNLGNILLRQYNNQVSKNCLINKYWISILWQEEELVFLNVLEKIWETYYVKFEFVCCVPFSFFCLHYSYIIGAPS